MRDTGPRAKAPAVGLAAMPTNLVEQLLEVFARDAKRPHVAADDVLTEVLVHFDYNRTRHACLRHYEMIALYSIHDAAG